MPPKPPSRPDRVSLWRYARLFRADILSAQPARLYRAWMAEFRTPFFRSYLLNQPDLVRQVLKDRPEDFPKSDRVGEGLRPLLGNSVFVTNGEIWARQRRIIDPAFEGGRLRDTFPAMWDAAEATAARFADQSGETVDIEEECSHAAADVIFRTLFSRSIDDSLARETYHAFRTYQRSQPILNLAALVPLPRWLPRPFGRRTRTSAARIRRLITDITSARADQIAGGHAPQDLATKIMTTADPQTGATFTTEEMVDQVAIFFLAGHETSASTLAWALYLMALYPQWQDRLAIEARALTTPDFTMMSELRLSRDVFLSLIHI